MKDSSLAEATPITSNLRNLLTIINCKLFWPFLATLFLTLETPTLITAKILKTTSQLWFYEQLKAFLDHYELGHLTGTY